MARLLKFEREARSRGATHICGIDEAGRGPLAGPVIAAAVILPADFHHPRLTDSKKLSPALRESIFAELTSHPSIFWGVAMIHAKEIDQINILQATWKAMVAARQILEPPPDWTLVDGLPVPPLGKSQTAIVGGDGLSFSIAAASIIAKVTRDRWMIELDQKYPQYGFARHKGYGTKDHLQTLTLSGPCPEHRHSFEPVARLRQPSCAKSNGSALLRPPRS